MQLQLAMPQLNAAADLNVSAGADLIALFSWLAQFGLPAAPWQPDPAWLELQLPALSLNASALATISAFAQLRADVLAQFGIDLLIPGQTSGFVRLAATLQARLAAMLALDANVGLSLDASAWSQLSATLTAIANVQAALALGLFPSPPAGPPLSIWRGFLVRLRALLPVIAASTQLGLDLSADIAAQLSPMLRSMLRISLPGFPPASLQLMANLTAALSAVAQVRQSLNIDPLAVGLPAVRLMVAERAAVTANAIQSSLGMTVPSLLALLNQLPRPEFSAAMMAPPAVVQAAMRINPTALAAIDWQVPASASLPVLSVGLPVAAFTGQMNAALRLSASAAPCGAVCDAAALMRA